MTPLFCLGDRQHDGLPRVWCFDAVWFLGLKELEYPREAVRKIIKDKSCRELPIKTRRSLP